MASDITTFGFSVSGSLDLDGNDYPDMIVGAYNSDAAFFFRLEIHIRKNPFELKKNFF